MNRWYKQLQKLAVETRTKNAAFFKTNHGDPRLSAELEKIWRDYDNGIEAIRGDIAENVRQNLLSKNALTSFDTVISGLTLLSGRQGGDWVGNPSGTALFGAETVISAAGTME